MQSSAVLQPKWSTVEEMGRGFLGWSAEGVAGTFLLALPPGAVGRILKSTHTVAQVVLPEGASVAFVVHGESGMQMLLDRVDVLAEMVMDGLLQRFRQHAAHLRVDAELAIVTRRQCADSLLLEGQMRYWRGQCALTSVKTSSVLRAVRLRRWEDCDTDAERLDVIATLCLHEMGHFFCRYAEHYDHPNCVHVAPTGLNYYAWHQAVRAAGPCRLAHQTTSRF